MYRPKSNPQVVLRPQDLVVLLRLSLESGAPPTYAALGSELGMTASEVHAGLERAVLAQLARKGCRRQGIGGARGRSGSTCCTVRLFLSRHARRDDARHADRLCGAAAAGEDRATSRAGAGVATQASAPCA